MLLSLVRVGLEMKFAAAAVAAAARQHAVPSDQRRAMVERAAGWMNMKSFQPHKR